MEPNSGETSSDAGRGYTGPENLRLGFRPFFLAAGIGTTLCYGLVGVAAFTRVLAPLVPDGAALLFGLSGLAWIGAFGLFAILYGPLLMGRARR